MKNKKPMSLRDLFLNKIQALYDIESEIIKALPKMIESATDKDLRNALSEHLEETEKQAGRLEEIFDIIGAKPKKLKCDGIRGIIDDNKWIIKNVSGATALDANIVAGAQYVEHYEIAGYGSAVEWARLLGHDDAADLLDETLEEERAASDKLLKMATSKLNQEALGSDENTEDDVAEIVEEIIVEES